FPRRRPVHQPGWVALPHRDGHAPLGAVPVDDHRYHHGRAVPLQSHVHDADAVGQWLTGEVATHLIAQILSVVDPSHFAAWLDPPTPPPALHELVRPAHRNGSRITRSAPPWATSATTGRSW